MPSNKAFPHQIGSIVRINAAGNPDLIPCDGFWGVVVQTKPGLDFAEVETWNGTFSLRTKNVVHHYMSQSARLGAALIMKRLKRLAANFPSAVVVDVIQGIARRPTACLSELEEAIIAMAEMKRELEPLDENAPHIHPDTKADKSEHQHNNWVVDVVSQNLEFLKELHLRTIAGTIASRRPDMVKPIALELAREENLARSIVAAISMIHSEPETVNYN